MLSLFHLLAALALAVEILLMTAGERHGINLQTSDRDSETARTFCSHYAARGMLEACQTTSLVDKRYLGGLVRI